jgi:hypothetical protein
VLRAWVLRAWYVFFFVEARSRIVQCLDGGRLQGLPVLGRLKVELFARRRPLASELAPTADAGAAGK